jgi:hypothetical protein
VPAAVDAEPGPVLAAVVRVVRRASGGSELAVGAAVAVLSAATLVVAVAVGLAVLLLVAGTGQWLETTFGTLRDRPLRALALAALLLGALLGVAAAAGWAAGRRRPGA